MARLPQELLQAVAARLQCHRAVGACRDHLAYALPCPHNVGYEYVFLLNGYRPGDHIRHHADDEQQLLRGSPIISYSFGRRVDFVVREKRGEQAYHIRTQDGLRITMEGPSFQDLFTHGIAKRKDDPPDSYRISVTVRISRQQAGDRYAFSNTAARKLSIDARQYALDAPCAGDPVLPLVLCCARDAVPLLDAFLQSTGSAGHSRRKRRRR